MSIRINIHKAFNKIGNSNGTVLPEFDRSELSNQEVSELMETLPLVHEMFVAGELRSAANARYDAIKKALIDKGIVDLDSLNEGDKVTPYQSPVYSLSVDVKRAASRLDATKFATELARRGVSKKIIDEATEAATKKSAPAKTISVSLVDD